MVTNRAKTRGASRASMSLPQPPPREAPCRVQSPGGAADAGAAGAAAWAARGRAARSSAPPLLAGVASGGGHKKGRGGGRPPLAELPAAPAEGTPPPALAVRRPHDGGEAVARELAEQGRAIAAQAHAISSLQAEVATLRRASGLFEKVRAGQGWEGQRARRCQAGWKATAWSDSC